MTFLHIYDIIVAWKGWRARCWNRSISGPSRGSPCFLVRAAWEKPSLAQELQKRRGSQGVCAFWDDWEFRKKAISSPYSILEEHQPLLFKKVLALIDEFIKAPKSLGAYI